MQLLTMGRAPSSLLLLKPLMSWSSVTASDPLYARKNLKLFMPSFVSLPMSKETCRDDHKVFDCYAELMTFQKCNAFALTRVDSTTIRGEL